jgi:Arc/MetJ family transcription regulator
MPMADFCSITSRILQRQTKREAVDDWLRTARKEPYAQAIEGVCAGLHDAG